MSLAVRVVARLDVKPSIGVVKGIRFDGLKRVGDPIELARRYQDQGADEILWLDTTASLMGRPAGIPDFLFYTPVTYGGGIRTPGGFAQVLRTGAEKGALNTGAFADLDLIEICAKAWGSQAVVVSIEAKKARVGWKAYTLGGREWSGWDVEAWARQAVQRGAGEILLTSVDRDGTRAGYDLELIRAVRASAPHTPLVASGGFGHPVDAASAIEAGASAVAVGTWLHRGGNVLDIKRALAEAGHEVRI